MNIPIPFRLRMRLLWADFFRNELLVCSTLFVFALLYAVMHHIWATWPEWFPYSSIVDEVVNTFATGYAAAFIFYIFTVYLPRKRRNEEMLGLAADHIRIIKENIDSFHNTLGFKVNPEPWDHDGNLVYMYEEKKLYERQYDFTLSEYPYGGCSYPQIPLNRFIDEYAPHAYDSIKEIKRALPSVTGTLRQDLDYCESICRIITSGNAPKRKYAHFMNNLYGLICVFEEKYGQID